jgi:hypothetical protein
LIVFVIAIPPGLDLSRVWPGILLGGMMPSLEEQVLKPIQDPSEMDLTLEEASARVKLDVPTLSRANNCGQERRIATVPLTEERRPTRLADRSISEECVHLIYRPG